MTGAVEAAAEVVELSAEGEGVEEGEEAEEVKGEKSRGPREERM